MKIHPVKPHPGPYRIPQIDSEFAGIIVAFGFIVMGLIAFPFAKWFLLSALGLGLVIALLFRLVRKG